MLRSLGYERFPTPQELRDALVDAGTERVIDVRDLPQSRRPGFSRRALEDILADAGIVHEHRRELGNARPIREIYRSGDLGVHRAPPELQVDREECRRGPSAPPSARREVRVSEGATRTGAMLRVRLVGRPSLELYGEALECPAGRRAGELPAWLALHPGAHARGDLAPRFWPDVLDESARARLDDAAWVDVRELRRALGDGRDEDALS